MAKKSGVNLGPSNFKDGGGLLSDVDVTWEKCTFEEFDYNGTQQATLCLKVDMKVEDGENVDQYFSLGAEATKNFSINDDETGLEGDGSINRSSKYGVLIDSLVAAGFPADKIDGDVSVFDGLEAHMVRVASKRKGLAPRTREDGKVFEAQDFVVDKITKLPWDDKKGKGKGKDKDTGSKKGKDKDEDSSSGDGDLESKAQDIVTGVLEDNPKGLDKKKLVAAVFQKTKGDSDANAITKLVYTDEFLDCPLWDYDKKKGTIKPL